MKNLTDVVDTLKNLTNAVQRLQALPTVQPTISLADGLTTIKGIDPNAVVRINFDLETNTATWEAWIGRFTNKFDANTLEALVAKITDHKSAGTPISKVQADLHQLQPIAF